ncbi:ABC transporter ATP-binding protein [Clostridium manihotivorum]|uniref:Quaternary amine transport ATP-binding protein n=1 Tax=Clostridium manihotivorum TaxID=2320868 RepID=A0A3R5V7J0_9CLOT|nr:ABC transporter ATP-binding protein [Clostridium manihotivorum]QAA31867.1 proline/glycine betaine ABC transporter ATP-binding protein [Clostridium manihotivorum]
MIEFKNISKQFNNKNIIDKFNLSIEDGDFVVLIGPSGCGKTTLLKMINKLNIPTSGEILIDSKDISTIDTIELRRNIGYVIQNTGLFPHMTVRENIELIPKLKGEDLEALSNNCKTLLSMVGLNPTEYLDRFPEELSGGQRQRVGFVRALATNANIILMDEPFSALDPITRSSLQEELFQMQQELKKTIVFVTHDMDEAIKLGSKICILQNGRIAQYDTPENILKRPASSYVEDFIGKNRIWNNPSFIKAKDIMMTDPIKTTPKRSVLQAFEIMKSNKVDSLLITNKNNELEGLITLKQLKLENRSASIEDLMTKDITKINEDTNLIEVLTLMNEQKIGYAPVVDSENKLKGLITRTSILSTISAHLIDLEVNF